MKKLKEYVSFFYFFILFVVYPFYFRNGYVQIGQEKYFFLKWSSIVFLAILIPLIIFLREFAFSCLDYMLAGYLLANVLSYCLSYYKVDAMYGTFGWNMGLFSQLLFVLICFVAQRWQVKELWGFPAFVWMALFGAAGVFVLGILNRFSVYPIPMESEAPGFISTLGSVNWYSGYWSVLAPLGWGAFMTAERAKNVGSRVIRICLGGYSLLAVLAGLTAGSSSVFLVFGICAAALIWKAFDAKKWLLGALEWLLTVALSMQALRWLHLLFPYGMRYDSKAIWYCMTRSIGGFLFFLLICIYLAVLFWLPEYKDAERLQRVRAYLFSVLIAVVICTVVIFVLNAVLPGGIWPVRGMDLFYFSDDWGNGRGGIWKDTHKAFTQMPLHQKLFGVGPDCYTCFVYEIPEIEEHLFNMFDTARLTNAHNEWYNTLINIGFFGLLSYVAIFAVALWSFAKKMREKPILFAMMLGILGYIFHNMVSFAQVLNTPFVFLVMGLGQGLTKQADSPKV